MGADGWKNRAQIGPSNSLPHLRCLLRSMGSTANPNGMRKRIAPFYKKSSERRDEPSGSFLFYCPLNIRSTWTALGPGGPRGVPQRSPGGPSGIPERSQRGPGEVPDGSRSGPRGMFEPNSFGTATGSPVGVSSLASLGLFGCPFGPLCGPLELPGSTLWAVLGPCWGCVRPS